MSKPDYPPDMAEPTEQSPLLNNGKSSNQSQEQDDDAERGPNPNQPDDSNSDQSPDTDSPLPTEPSTSQLILIMSGTWMGSFFAALDSTVIATLTAPISASFNSLSLLSWLASAYFIANAALQPLSGRLTDILSRRTGLVFSNIFFAAGNLICGFAQEEWMMIFGRVVAGMGGGGLTAISTFVGSDLIPLRRRGVWQGFGNISYGLGATLGGVLGGWINDNYSWRAAFFVQVPFSVISGLLVFFTVKVPVKKSDKPPWRRIDFTGAFFLIVTLVLLLLGINSGGNVVPWTHPLVLVSLPLSVVSLITFIFIEDRKEEPVIPVRLLLNRTVLSACLTNWFITMSLFAVVFYGPIFFQVRGLSTTQAGLLLVPQSIGTAFGSIIVGLMMRWLGRYYILSICVLTIYLIGQALIAAFVLETPIWEIVIAFAMLGVGYSGMLTTTLLALISSVEHKHQAVITSANYAFRSTGSTIGITIASAVFQNILQARLWDLLGDQENGPEIIRKLKGSLDAMKTDLSPEWRLPVQHVYVDALRGVFLTTLGISALGFLTNLGLREYTLHKNLARK